MTSEIMQAFNQLMVELMEATGLPEGPFTIVLTVLPVVQFDDQENDEGTSYKLGKIVINEEIWDAKF